MPKLPEITPISDEVETKYALLQIILLPYNTKKL